MYKEDKEEKEKDEGEFKDSPIVLLRLWLQLVMEINEQMNKAQVKSHKVSKVAVMSELFSIVLGQH